MHQHDCIVLNVTDLTVHLGGREILSGIDLTVRSGEFLGLIGPNGGGKTTFLRALLGLVPTATGQITWSPGECRPPRIGYVPQKTVTDTTYPLTARAVLLQGASRYGDGPPEGRHALQDRANALMERVGLDRQAGLPFVHLSGGQQRRLLLARALLRTPDALLLDEPTNGVDVEGQEQLCALLQQLGVEGITVILVSHDLPLITSKADRIACLNRTLHWHGRARDLDPTKVRNTFANELRRYGITQPKDSCAEEFQ
ncbi:MAG: ATP-binding cassette domain-containing protein [Verrucomicrobia bacterium]|nr:ATP-binding cassette domain-containing protein [Verrucomicrobiota bacterium]